MTTTELFKKDPNLCIQSAGLYIFAATLPFSVTLIQGGILLFIAAGLWRMYNAATLPDLAGRIKSNPLFIPWMIYLAAGVIAAISGIAPVHSLHELNSDLLTAVTFLGLSLFLEPGQRDKALNAYLVIIIAAAIYGIAQSLGGLTHGLDIRAHANQHPVRFGEIMVIGLGLALSRLSYPEALSARARKLTFAAVLLIVPAVVLSQTRGAYLGMVMVFITLLAARRPPVRVILPVIASAAVLGLALAMLNPAVRYKMSSITKGANSAINTGEKTADIAINTRLTLWRTGFKMIKDRPIFGAGPGNVKTLFPVYCPPPYPENTIWGSLHDLYIHQAAERGLVGLAALLTLFGAMFIIALRNFRAAPSQFTLWAISLIPAWYVMNVTEITFQHVHTSYTVLLALAVSITAAKTK